MRQRSRGPQKSEGWREALERAQLGVWDWDLRTGTCFYSASWVRMLGYEEGELTMDSDLWINLTHPDDRQRAIASGDEHIAGLTPHIETELRLRHKDGHWVWVLDRGGVAECDEAGRPTRLIGVQTDISKQKEAELGLAQVNTRFQLALAASGTGIWHHDVATKETFWDQRTREIFGVLEQPDVDLTQIWPLLIHPEDRERTELAHAEPHNWQDLMSFGYRIIRPDGAARHIKTFAKFIPDAGPSGLLVGTSSDVTHEVEAAEALLLEKERLRVTLGSISDAVISTDTKGRITFVNRAAAAMLRKGEGQLLGKPVGEALRLSQMTGLPKPGRNAKPELIEIAVGKKAALLRCAASPIRSSEGSALGTVYTLQDVTEETERQRELARATRYDALTGLLNRKAFDGQLAEWIRSADTAHMAVLYIDLDHFKALNDFAGHAAGDKALQLVASAIGKCLPAAGVAARLGGDEFAVLMPIEFDGQAEKVASAIISAVRETAVEGAARSLSASVGVAYIRESATNPADALACADDACYASKATGRNRSSVFGLDGTPALHSLNAARVAAEVIEALDDGRMQLFGQKIFSLEDDPASWRGIEVLARLKAKDGTSIPPSVFVPAAERFGIAPTLDRWIISKAMNCYGRAMKGDDRLSLALNLSAQTLSDPKLWEDVDRSMANAGVPPNRLVFEITETAAVTNFEAAERFVHAARERGCRVSLDDFGAGLSSFEYLRRFPVDTIKINGSFVQSMSTQPFDREIVSAISGIAKSLGYQVIAEKIEHADALEMLRGFGVKQGQGFLLHKPEPLDILIGRRSDDSRSAA